MPAKVMTGVLLCVLVGCGSEPTQMPPPGPTTPPPSPAPRWQSFSVTDLQTERAQQNVAFLEFLAEPSLRMGLYHLDAGALDNQEAHSDDEIYYVVSGDATLTIDGVDHTAAPGSALFVRAGVEHRFHTIVSDLDVLVVFVTGPSNSLDPVGRHYSHARMVAPRNVTANVWNQFFLGSTMSLGMYMLPQTAGGDAVLTHAFDEINIVVSGGSRFQMGSDVIDIEPGSIVYVEDGVGHRFTNLTEDVDVLILWER